METDDHPEPSAAPDAVDIIVAQWADRQPDLDTSPLQILGRVERVWALVDPLLRPRFAAAGLAPGDFEVLTALRRSDSAAGLSPSALAEAMLVTRGAVTKRVDRLLAAGLVTRGEVDGDRRAKVVALTPRGIRLTDSLIREHLAAEAELLDGLAPADADALAGLLRSLLRSVEERVQEPPE